MPLAAVIAREIFCVHGGISPNLEDLSQIDSISRPHRSSSRGLACDLLWSDPDSSTYTWKKNIHRNISHLYGKNQVRDFLLNNNLKSIIRAHEQPPDGGFVYPFFPETTVLTLFSAPGYEGSSSDGAVVRLDRDCVPSIRTLRYLKKRPKEHEDCELKCKRRRHK